VLLRTDLSHAAWGPTFATGKFVGSGHAQMLGADRYHPTVLAAAHAMHRVGMSREHLVARGKRCRVHCVPFMARIPARDRPSACLSAATAAAQSRAEDVLMALVEPNTTDEVLMPPEFSRWDRRRRMTKQPCAVARKDCALPLGPALRAIGPG
jgi:hypothetical protein